MSEKTVTGGPAFPVHGQKWDRVYGFSNMDFPGLSMRAYFAAKAMQGLLANPGGPVQASDLSGWRSTVNCTRHDVACEAIAYADALLAALQGEAPNE